MFCDSAHAATELWRDELATPISNITFAVDQIVADGNGGCAVALEATTTGEWSEIVYYYVAYYDKKGNKVWDKTYNDRWGDIAYSTKKATVIGLSDSAAGNAKVVVVDKKGVESVVEDPAANIDGRINSDLGPLGDKKGFFAEEKVIASGKVSLVRYSYK
jgi:hypothetical protein